MRVMLLTHWAPNILLFRSELLRQLIAQGAEVVVVAPAIEAFPHEKLHAMGVETFPLTAHSNTLIPWHRYVMHRELRRAIDHWDPDALITFSHFPNISAARVLRRNEEIRWIGVVTGMGRIFIPKSGFREEWRRLLACGLRWEYRRSAPLLHRLLLLNRDDLQLVQSWHPLLKEKSEQLPLGEGVNSDHYQIDPELRQRWRAEQKIPEGATLCAFIGRFLPEKGVELFLSLAEKSLKRSKKIKERAGENPQESQQENLYWILVGQSDLSGTHSGIDRRVEALEHHPCARVFPWQSDLRPLYNGIDLLLLPSRREGLPITPLEAMACGTTVLAYDAPGSRELEGEGCRLLKSLEPQEWFAAISQERSLPREEQLLRSRSEAERYDHRMAMGAILRYLQEEPEEPKDPQ